MDSYLSALTEHMRDVSAREGRVSVEEERPSKLLLDKVVAFESLPQELWLQFADMDACLQAEASLNAILRAHPGKDTVVLYLRQERQMKRLSFGVALSDMAAFRGELENLCGEENIRVVSAAGRH